MYTSVLASALAFGVLAVAASAQELSTWNRSLEDGQKAARKSGKPVLYVTNWKPDV